MPGDSFYSTPAWRRLRSKVKKRWRIGGLPCHFCEQPLDWKQYRGLIVDHIINRKLRPDLALVESNLVVVHHACNSKKAAWEETERDIPEIGVDGFPVNSKWSE
jgi:5-methylcytosine-specific restriction endonuclease McrA